MDPDRFELKKNTNFKWAVQVEGCAERDYAASALGWVGGLDGPSRSKSMFNLSRMSRYQVETISGSWYMQLIIME